MVSTSMTVLLLGTHSLGHPHTLTRLGTATWLALAKEMYTKQIEPFDGWWSVLQPILLLLRNCGSMWAQMVPKAIPDALLERNLAGWL